LALPICAMLQALLTARAWPQPGVRVVAGSLDEQVSSSRTLVLPSSPFPGGTVQMVDQGRTATRRAGRDLPESAPASPPSSPPPDPRRRRAIVVVLSADTDARILFAFRPATRRDDPPWRRRPAGDTLPSRRAPSG